MRFLLVLIFTLSTSVSAEVCQPSSKNFCDVKVTKIYDGDTITVNLKDLPPVFGKKISVRIRGIDTAEVRGKGQCEKAAARTARRLVENLVKNGKSIDLINVERDKYFRLLADVLVDGKMVKDILIKNRLAVSYHGKTKMKVDWCKRVPASED